MRMSRIGTAKIPHAVFKYQDPAPLPRNFVFPARARTFVNCLGHAPGGYSNRRGGRVVECGGLENRYTRKGIESSNLSLSAPSNARSQGLAFAILRWIAGFSGVHLIHDFRDSVQDITGLKLKMNSMVSWRRSKYAFQVRNV